MSSKIVKTITLDVDEDWLKDFDDWVIANGFKTRSAAMRFAMTEQMKRGRK
jgi:metal-responsive CopG/Arc/MetJ family transcriptional regulator